jgi:hypothetical protein
MGSIHKSPSCKKLENVVWEVLNKAWYVDEKLIWDEFDGNVSSDGVFYTPLGSPSKEGTNSA